MTTDPPIYTGVCPYCASAISTVTLEGGKAYARCSHRRCGARGPLMANTERAVDVFTRGKWSIRAAVPEPEGGVLAMLGAAPSHGVCSVCEHDPCDDACPGEPVDDGGTR